MEKDVKLLFDYIKSGCNCIFIESYDYFKVINSLYALSKEIEKDFLYYDLDKKLCKFNNLLLQTIDKKIMSENAAMELYFEKESVDYETANEKREIYKLEFNKSFLLINFANVNPLIMVTKIKNFLSFRKQKMYKDRILIFFNSEVPDLLRRDVKVIRLEPLNDAERLSTVERIFSTSEKVDGKTVMTSFYKVPEEAEKLFISETKGLTTSELTNMSLLGKLYNFNDDFFKLLKEEKIKMINSKGFLEYIESDISLDDVIGLDYLKNWLIHRKNYKENTKHNLINTKGILLLGIPGTGKSYISKAIGNLFGLPTLRLDIGRILCSFVGESEKNLREVLSLIEALSPCVLWLDEIEKALSISQNSSDSGVSYRIFGNLLFWLQETKKDIFVVATSNNIAQLPPELLRKGRFDEIFFVDLPNEKERKAMFEFHIKKYLSELGFDSCDYYEQFASISDGFSGAEIEGVIQNTVIQFVSEGSVDRADASDYFFAILNKNIESTKPLSVTMSESINKFKEWVEGRVVKA